MLKSGRSVVFARAMGVLIAAAVLLAFACSDAKSPPSAQPADMPYEVQTRTFFSVPYLVDQIYRSMKGPMNAEIIQIGDESPPERIWIVSFETEILDAETGDPVSDEFMCHNTLDFRSKERHQERLGTQPGGQTTPRVFTLSQGTMSVQFPSGFGLPVMSDEKFINLTQVLNLNPIDEARSMKYKTTIRYVRDSDARGRIRPLYQKGVQGMKIVSGDQAYYGLEDGNEEDHGQGCSVGELIGDSLTVDQSGGSFTNHWVVKAGREENHTYATTWLGLTQDTTAHYIAVHLHPFAESLELRDVTSDVTIFKAEAINRDDRIGLEFVESFSSEAGIPLYKDHEYSLISVYDNSSTTEQDAMASMFIYMLDRNFEKTVHSPDSLYWGSETPPGS